MPSTITVCLDNNDYSYLSDPRRQSAQRDELKNTLLGFAKLPRVRFAYSGSHLSEMAPLEVGYAPAAVARADLLGALCGRNAFISMDRVLRYELGRALGIHSGAWTVLSADGSWFPDIASIMPPVRPQ